MAIVSFALVVILVVILVALSCINGLRRQIVNCKTDVDDCNKLLGIAEARLAKAASQNREHLDTIQNLEEQLHFTESELSSLKAHL